MPNREEQFDFFSSNKFVQDPEEPKPQDTIQSEPTEQTVLLLEGIDSVETIYQRALYISHDKQKEIENKFMFMPSSKNSNYKQIKRQ
jgi:hypothetical protein